MAAKIPDIPALPKCSGQDAGYPEPERDSQCSRDIGHQDSCKTVAEGHGVDEGAAGHGQKQPGSQDNAKVQPMVCPVPCLQLLLIQGACAVAGQQEHHTHQRKPSALIPAGKCQKDAPYPYGQVQKKHCIFRIHPL